ncbi:MAG TPA: TIR-like protein FxsC [Pyrinomonadaceae bacterium]|jgi:FxsC-like protein|nr:TIR-like protein FxsC [Pyrinomonadaceae bacterium]
MAPWFFLSYARENNRDKYVDEFFKDLNGRIRDLTGSNEDSFFDTTTLEVGQPWPEATTEALQSCRCFIPLCSPAYFNSDYCGEEWQFFASRQAAYAGTLHAGQPKPQLILPVRWIPDRLGCFPSVADQIQSNHAAFGEQYADTGLQEFIRLKSKYQTEYENFLHVFANRVIDAAKPHVLPRWSKAPTFDQLESAFHHRQSSRPPHTETSNDSRSVRFMFVAGRRDELQPVREKVDAYGEEGGEDWQPYIPDSPRAGIIAAEVAVQQDLLYAPVELNANILVEIKKAEEEKRIVAIIVDGWTLQIEPYGGLMKEYDDKNFVNCAVIVPLNNNDEETRRQKEYLDEVVKRTFANEYAKPSGCFGIVYSHDQLKKELASALNKARTRLVTKIKLTNDPRSSKMPTISGVR